jgi:hypothetical protein
MMVNFVAGVCKKGLWPKKAKKGQKRPKIAGMMIDCFASVCKEVYGQKKPETLYAPVAKRIRRQSPNPKVPGSSPPGAQFFFCSKCPK